MCTFWHRRQEGTLPCNSAARAARALCHTTPPVWLKYCVALRGLSMIVVEQSTEAFSPYYAPRLTMHCSLRRDKPVVETLRTIIAPEVGGSDRTVLCSIHRT